jgi:hypothetical protein
MKRIAQHDHYTSKIQGASKDEDLQQISSESALDSVAVEGALLEQLTATSRALEQTVAGNQLSDFYKVFRSMDALFLPSLIAKETRKRFFVFVSSASAGWGVYYQPWR